MLIPFGIVIFLDFKRSSRPIHHISEVAGYAFEFFTTLI